MLKKENYNFQIVDEFFFFGMLRNSKEFLAHRKLHFPGVLKITRNHTSLKSEKLFGTPEIRDFRAL